MNLYSTHTKMRRITLPTTVAYKTMVEVKRRRWRLGWSLAVLLACSPSAMAAEGKPLDKNIYELKGEELAAIPKVPGSLRESIDALEKDHKFLKAGGVLTDALISSWINWKREKELAPVALRPHPHEFALHYDS